MPEPTRSFTHVAVSFQRRKAWSIALPLYPGQASQPRILPSRAFKSVSA
jgi:hypothetical protein